MPSLASFNLQRLQSRALAVLRITTACMYFWHGTAKFFGYPVSMGEISLFSLMAAAGVLELAAACCWRWGC